MIAVSLTTHISDNTIQSRQLPTDCTRQLSDPKKTLDSCRTPGTFGPRTVLGGSSLIIRLGESF